MLLDTSAWIEYLKGTNLGGEIKSLSEKTSFYTCPLTFAEITNWVYKNNEGPEPHLQKIKNLSKILELNEDILVNSGKTYYRERKNNEKISMIDCIIYTTARYHDLILLTKDNDFKDLPYVRILE
ncbi:PIN domain-containing protein [Candidatus Micrarchaeota archaeon]|nr:PIN domain-containing protein [Candidatus Micrarchaeota archaeon]